MFISMGSPIVLLLSFVFFVFCVCDAIQIKKFLDFYFFFVKEEQEESKN